MCIFMPVFLYISRPPSHFNSRHTRLRDSWCFVQLFLHGILAPFFRVDLMIIGGGMAFTFKKTLENMKIGNSLFDEDGAKIVDEIMKEAKAKNVEVLLPVDFVCGDKFAADAKTQVCDDKTGVPDGWMGLDVGPKTVELAKAVRWICNSCIEADKY